MTSSASSSPHGAVNRAWPSPRQAWWWTARATRSEQAANRATGRADIISSGILATAAGGHGTQYGMPIPTVEDAADAAGFVADRMAEGSAFVKIVIEDGSSYGRTMPTLDAGRVVALVEAAHAHDALAVAHVARLESARMALEAGVDGLVHIWADRTPDRSLVEGLAAAGIFVIPTGRPTLPCGFRSSAVVPTSPSSSAPKYHLIG